MGGVIARLPPGSRIDATRIDRTNRPVNQSIDRLLPTHGTRPIDPNNCRPNPPSKPKPTRRVATGAAVVFTAFQLVLRTDYGEKEHVFTPVR